MGAVIFAALLFVALGVLGDNLWLVGLGLAEFVLVPLCWRDPWRWNRLLGYFIFLNIGLMFMATHAGRDDPKGILAGLAMALLGAVVFVLGIFQTRRSSGSDV